MPGSLRRSFPRTARPRFHGSPPTRGSAPLSIGCHAQYYGSTTAGRIPEIPAQPSFQEAPQREAAVKELLAENRPAAHIDKTGDVIGELRGFE